MIGKNEEESKVISIPAVLDILEKRKKDGELGYEQQLAYEHASKCASISKSEAEKMQKELEEAGLSAKGAIKVIDVMPINDTQLKQVLVIEKKNIEEETIKKVMEIVNKFKK